MTCRFLAGLTILFLLIAIPSCNQTKSTSHAPSGAKASPVGASSIKMKPG
jgi:hypothetical protein